MLGTPVDWNIVIAGAWNVAILTPNGIADRLLNLAPESPVEVQVAIDDVSAPIRVKYDGIVIQPSSTNLVISPQDASPEQLNKAVDIATRALNTLPETPLSAIGLNLRFQFEDIPNALIDVVESPIDDLLSDQALQISEKILKRKITWEEGVLNLDVKTDNHGAALMLFNYHKGSNKPKELCDWLRYHSRMIENSHHMMRLLIEER